MSKPETLDIELTDNVMLISLDRPDVLNALNAALLDELCDALDAAERNNDIGAVVITGKGRAFAAGADIAEMAPISAAEMYISDRFSNVSRRFGSFRKPIVAAVNGFALGGGCELAMLCDFIIASEAAKFGQPEIKLGVLPGIGGTQRLARFVGKAKAMDLCLTSRMMDAAEAERSGLASRVVPAESLMDEAMAAAKTIASMSRPTTYLVKEAVNHAFETSLSEGCHLERRLFHAAFALEDQSEGMAAFLEKRPPVWKHR